MEFKNEAIKNLVDTRIENKYPGISTFEDVEEAKNYMRFCEKSGCGSVDAFHRWNDIKRKARTKGVSSIIFHSDVLSFRKGVVPASPNEKTSEYLEVCTKYGTFYVFKDGSVSDYIS